MPLQPPLTRSFNDVAPARPTNAILAALPQGEYDRLSPHLQPVDLPQGKMLYDVDEPVRTVYFHESGMTSLVVTSDEGTDVEVGVIGWEGVVGGGSGLTSTLSPCATMIQLAGKGYAMPVEVMKLEFKRGGLFQELMLCHMQMLSVMMGQCGLCNRLHSVEERLSRWLLMASDQTGLERLELTQEFIANMLGTRRSGVTVAAGLLRAAGLIDYARGSIVIIDRAGLESSACECYGVVNKHLMGLKRAEHSA